MPKIVKALNIEKTYDRNDERVLYDEKVTDNNCNVIRRSVIVEKPKDQATKKHQTMISRIDTSYFENGFSNFYHYRNKNRNSHYLTMMTDRQLAAMRGKKEKLDIIKKAEALKVVSDTAKRVVHEKNLTQSLARGC